MDTKVAKETISIKTTIVTSKLNELARNAVNNCLTAYGITGDLCEMPIRDYLKSVRQADLVIAFGPIGDKVANLIDTEALACKFYRLPAPALLDRETGDEQQRLMAAEILKQIVSELNSVPRENLILTAQVKDEVVRIGGITANNQINLSELLLIKEAMRLLNVDKIDITFQKETEANGKTEEKQD